MKKRVVLTTSIILTFLTLSSSLILSSITVSAEDVVDNIAITVPSACSFTSSTQDATFTRTLNNNHYESGIGTNTFTVTCNDIAGFSIYAIGYSGEEYGNTDMLPSTSGLPAIATGTATSGNNSAWAMRLTPVTGTYAPTITSDTEGPFSSYHTVPSTYAKVATFTSIVDGSVGSSMTSDYAVFISSTQPAGTYTGKVKYTLVHPNDAPTPTMPVVTDPGYISYNPNAPGVTDSMGDQAIGASDTSADLWASNFQRSGYGFAGWTDNPNYVLNSGNNTTVGHIYGPNETIDDSTTLASIQSDGLSLYAVWVPSAGNLQGWSGCSSLPQGNVTALTDQRDNQVYAVAKLADGMCWMIENLRLDNTASHNSDGTLAQGYGGVFAGLANPETANFSSATTANSLYYSNTQSGTATIDIGTTNPGYRFPRFNNQNTASPVSNMTSVGSNVYSYGNYYTWSAALANTNNYTGATTQVDGKTSETANTSICPSGWRIPYGRDTGNGATPGGFSHLDLELGGTGTTSYNMSNMWRKYPNNFIYSGNFNPSSPNGRGGGSYYWSSTSSTQYRSSYFLLNGDVLVYPGTGTFNKFYGLPVRCVKSN